jgi:hypothetical protein
MESSDTQLRFFQNIKAMLPPHVSFVDEIANLLNISNDSAYRRIRADKPISFEELQKLCVHYKISLDQFLNLQNDTFIFFGKIHRDSGFAFEDWLGEVLKQYTIISSFEKKHIYFLLKDLPFNQHFLIPELTAFKCFVWMKFFSDYDPAKEMKFSFNYPGFEKYNAIGQKIVDVYNTIPTTELWNTEAINTTIRQIEYYYESGNVISKEQAAVLFDKVIELVNHIEKEAELGFKFKMGILPPKPLAEYKLFNNEMRLGDNSLLAEMGDIKVAFVNHSYMHFIGTRDETFTKAMFRNMNYQTNKGTLISTSGERERVKFFNQMREEIRQRKAALL